MSEMVTYVHPYDRRSSHTYKPSGPFDLIDTTEKDDDYGSVIDEAMSEFSSSLKRLFDVLRDTPGRVEVSLESCNNTSGYGELSDRSVALLYASLLGDKVTLSFRTRREAMECIYNVLVDMIDRLPEDQLPDFWDALKDYHKVDVPHLIGEDRIEYRLAALALRILNDSRWWSVGESQDKHFDNWGNVSVPAGCDIAHEIISGPADRCISCGKKTSEMKYFVQLNRYTRMCSDCVESASKIFSGGHNAIVTCNFKSQTTTSQEAVERMDDIFSSK